MHFKEAAVEESPRFSLINRFYDVDRGQILTDDVDIRDYDLKILTYQRGVDLQMTILFSGYLVENIRYGRLNATENEVYILNYQYKKCLKRSGIWRRKTKNCYF